MVASEAIHSCLAALKGVEDQRRAKEISSQGIYWASRILGRIFDQQDHSILDTIAGIFRELLRATEPSRDQATDADVFGGLGIQDANDWIESFEVDKLLTSNIANSHVGLQTVLLEALMRRQWGQKIAWTRVMENEKSFHEDERWRQWTHNNYDKFDPICIAVAAAADNHKQIQQAACSKASLFECYPLLWQLMEADEALHQALETMSVSSMTESVDLISRMMDLLDGAHALLADPESLLYFQRPINCGEDVDVDDHMNWWLAILKEFSSRLLRHHGLFLVRQSFLMQQPQVRKGGASDRRDKEPPPKTHLALLRLSLKYECSPPKVVADSMISNCSRPLARQSRQVTRLTCTPSHDVKTPDSVTSTASVSIAEQNKPTSLATVDLSMPTTKRKAFRARSPHKRGHRAIASAKQSASTVKNIDQETASSPDMTMQQFRWVFLHNLGNERLNDVEALLEELG